MELKELIGKHILSGVDMLNQSIKKYGFDEDCEVVNFVLDGKTYTAIEDPEDGYRSCMEEIKESDYQVVNKFIGVEVEGKMKPDDNEKYGEKNEIIQFFDTKNNLLILEIGTGNTDDYYPYWVADFYPENMNINKQKFL